MDSSPDLPTTLLSSSVTDAARSASHMELKKEGYHLYSTKYQSPFIIPYQLPPGSRLYTTPRSYQPPYLSADPSSQTGFLVIPQHYNPQQIALELEHATLAHFDATNHRHFAVTNNNPFDQTGTAQAPQITPVQPLAALNVPTYTHTPYLPPLIQPPVPLYLPITLTAASLFATYQFSKHSISKKITQQLVSLQQAGDLGLTQPKNTVHLTLDFIKPQVRRALTSVACALPILELGLTSAAVFTFLNHARTKRVLDQQFRQDNKVERAVTLQPNVVSPLIICHPDPQYSIHPSALAFLGDIKYTPHDQSQNAPAGDKKQEAIAAQNQVIATNFNGEHSALCNVALDAPSPIPSSSNILFDAYDASGQVVTAFTGQRSSQDKAQAEYLKQVNFKEREKGIFRYLPTVFSAVPNDTWYGLFAAGVITAAVSAISHSAARYTMKKIYNDSTLLLRNLELKQAKINANKPSFIAHITPQQIHRTVAEHHLKLTTPTLHKLAKLSVARVFIIALFSAYSYKLIEQGSLLTNTPLNQQHKQIVGFSAEHASISQTPLLSPPLQSSLLSPLTTRAGLTQVVQDPSKFIDDIRVAHFSHKDSIKRHQDDDLPEDEKQAYIKIAPKLVQEVCEAQKAHKNTKEKMGYDFVPPQPDNEVLKAQDTKLAQYLSSRLALFKKGDAVEDFEEYVANEKKDQNLEKINLTETTNTSTENTETADVTESPKNEAESAETIVNKRHSDLIVNAFWYYSLPPTSEPILHQLPSISEMIGWIPSPKVPKQAKKLFSDKILKKLTSKTVENPEKSAETDKSNIDGKSDIITTKSTPEITEESKKSEKNKDVSPVEEKKSQSNITPAKSPKKRETSYFDGSYSVLQGILSMFLPISYIRPVYPLTEAYLQQQHEVEQIKNEEAAQKILESLPKPVEVVSDTETINEKNQHSEESSNITENVSKLESTPTTPTLPAEVPPPSPSNKLPQLHQFITPPIFKALLTQTTPALPPPPISDFTTLSQQPSPSYPHISMAQVAGITSQRQFQLLTLSTLAAIPIINRCVSEKSFPTTKQFIQNLPSLPSQIIEKIQQFRPTIPSKTTAIFVAKFTTFYCILAYVCNLQYNNTIKTIRHSSTPQFPDRRTGILTDSLLLDNSKLVYYDKTAPHNIKLQSQKQEEKRRTEEKLKEEKQKEKNEKFGSQQTVKRLIDSALKRQKEQEQKDKDKTAEDELQNKLDEHGNLKLSKKQKIIKFYNYCKHIVLSSLYIENTPLEKRFLSKSALTDPQSTTNLLFPLWQDYDHAQQQAIERARNRSSVIPKQQQQYQSLFTKPNYQYTHILQKSNVFMLLDQQNLHQEFNYIYAQLRAAYSKKSNDDNEQHINTVSEEDTQVPYSGVPFYYLTSPL